MHLCGSSMILSKLGGALSHLLGGSMKRERRNVLTFGWVEGRSSCTEQHLLKRCWLCWRELLHNQPRWQGTIVFVGPVFVEDESPLTYWNIMSKHCELKNTWVYILLQSQCEGKSVLIRRLGPVIHRGQNCSWKYSKLTMTYPFSSEGFLWYQATRRLLTLFPAPLARIPPSSLLITLFYPNASSNMTDNFSFSNVHGKHYYI